MVEAGENQELSKEKINAGYCLACSTRALGDVIVEVPETALNDVRIFVSGLGAPESGAKPGERLGMAFDIGTTTIAGSSR